MSYVCKRHYCRDEDDRRTVLYVVVYLDPDPDLYRQPVAELDDHDQALRLVNYLNGGSGEPFDWDLEKTTTVTITPGATTEAGKGDDEANGCC